MTINLGNFFINTENGVVDATGNHTINNLGIAISTSTYKNGIASMDFNGSTSRALVATNSDFNFGLGDFTIDAWIMLQKTGWNTILNIGKFGNTGSLLWLVSSTTAYAGETASNQWYPPIGTTLQLNTWYHYAITRKDGVTRLFLNGTKFGETSQYSNLNINSTINGVTIGVYGGSVTNPFDGYMDDLRIVKGTALWTANFELTDIGLSLKNDPIPVSLIYNIGHRGNLRGKAKQGYIRPTIKQFFTSANFEEDSK